MDKRTILAVGLIILVIVAVQPLHHPEVRPAPAGAGPGTAGAGARPRRHPPPARGRRRRRACPPSGVEAAPAPVPRRAPRADRRRPARSTPRSPTSAAGSRAGGSRPTPTRRGRRTPRAPRSAASRWSSSGPARRAAARFHLPRPGDPGRFRRPDGRHADRRRLHADRRRRPGSARYPRLLASRRTATRRTCSSPSRTSATCRAPRLGDGLRPRSRPPPAGEGADRGGRVPSPPASSTTSRSRRSANAQELGPVSWVGVGNRYFLAALLPQEGAFGASSRRTTEPARRSACARSAASLAPAPGRGLPRHAPTSGRRSAALSPPPDTSLEQQRRLRLVLLARPPLPRRSSSSASASCAATGWRSSR